MGSQAEFRRPVFLRDLVALDEENRSEPNSFAECLGDAFLLKHNKLYAVMRRLFISLNCSCSSARTPLRDDYEMIPLLGIHYLMESGVLPLFDNARVARRLIMQQPFAEASLLRFARKNYLLHESAHCVAYRLLEPYCMSPGIREVRKLYVLRCLLCEAYANAVERIAASAASQTDHEFLFSFNSYIEPEQARTIRHAMPILGFEGILILGLTACFRLNCNWDWKEDDIEGLMSAWRSTENVTTGAEEFAVRQLIAQGFLVNRTFTSETNALFFQHMHCGNEFRQLCSLGPTSIVSEHLVADGIGAIASATISEFAGQS